MNQPMLDEHYLWDERLPQIIQKLRSHLLRRMKRTLQLSSPRFVELMEAGSADNFFNYERAEKELSEPTQPWTDLLNALLDLELAIDFFTVSVEGINECDDGRHIHFFIQTQGIYMRATLERLEHFVKRAVRKKLYNDEEDALARISQALKHEGLCELRNVSAHGRFTGTGRPIGDTQTVYYWEPYAVVPIEEDHLSGWHLAQANNAAILRKSYSDQAKDFLIFVGQVLGFVEAQLRE